MLYVDRIGLLRKRLASIIEVKGGHTEHYVQEEKEEEEISSDQVFNTTVTRPIERVG